MLVMKRVAAANKKQSGASLEEGKKATDFKIYKKLCEELYKGKCEDYMFAHAFLTMEWSLMTISEN